jgi:hypothetical protein
LELVKHYRQYRLADIEKPPETEFILDSDMSFDTLMKEGFSYFENLARYVNDNPPRPQDMAMLGMLETLGIAHGRVFKPDERMTQILTRAANVGLEMAKTLAYKPRIPDDLLYIYPGKRQWRSIFFGDPTFHTPDYMAIDQRAKFTFEAIGTAKSMVIASPGQGSQYVGAYQDKDGAWLSGENTYHMHLPANIPAKDFWSLTVYDNTTRSMIQNDLGPPLVGSVHGVKANDDGSVDIYFGPSLPDGVAKENFVQTNPDKGWFAYLRLYGPEEPWFDKQWIPGDAELVAK